MNSLSDVVVLIVNWNGGPDAAECLRSLDASLSIGLHAVVCDNASSDDSVDQILASAVAQAHGVDVVDWRREAPAVEPTKSVITIMRASENLGFAEGNNLALAQAIADCPGCRYVWLLNADTCAQTGAAEALRLALESSPSVGAVQSLLVNAADPSKVDSAGVELTRRGARDVAPGQSASMYLGNDPVRIFGCCAASAMYRRSCIDQLGLFDPGLFAIFEDVDLSCRWQASGVEAQLVPASVVLHRRGVSGGPKQKRRSRLSWRRMQGNRLIIIARWWPRRRAALILPIEIVRFVLSSKSVSEALASIRRSWGAVAEFFSGAGPKVRAQVYSRGAAKPLSAGAQGAAR